METAGALERCLTVEEWQHVELLASLLKPFMQIQRILEAEKTITLSIVPVVVFMMRTILENFASAPTGTEVQRNVKAAAMQMRAKFTERWGSGADGTVFSEHRTPGERNIRKGLPRLAMMACLLDPRLKGRKWCSDSDKELVWNEIQAEMEAIAIASGGTSIPPTRPETTQNSKKELFDEIFGDANDVQCDTFQPNNAVLTQLASYKAVIAQSDIDPLAWWEANQKSYPTLSILAKRILSIPATSAPSERTCSTAGKITGDERARLRPDTASDLVFLHESLEVVTEETQRNQ
jgi:hypothetical protein